MFVNKRLCTGTMLFSPAAVPLRRNKETVVRSVCTEIEDARDRQALQEEIGRKRRVTRLGGQFAASPSLDQIFAHITTSNLSSYNQPLPTVHHQQLLRLS
jgi:hypothetical protein